MSADVAIPLAELQAGFINDAPCAGAVSKSVSWHWKRARRLRDAKTPLDTQPVAHLRKQVELLLSRESDGYRKNAP